MTELFGSSGQTCATGRQFEIVRGDARAVITELAAGLRLYSRAGIDLTETYADEDIAPVAAGLPFAPWPNRIADGRWELDGKTQQLDITEVRRGNAIHGLLRNTGYRLLEQDEHSVQLAATIFPQHGYRFQLEHRVRYLIDGNLDLQVTQELQNYSAQRAPFALGAHPYLRLGDTPSEELTLTVGAQQRLVTNDKMIPVGSEPAHDQLDLRNGVRVGDLDLDAAYTELQADGSQYRHVLRDAAGRSVTLLTDEIFPYVHVFVTTKFPGRAKAVALEPMTAPANAFNSGDGLRWLEPGKVFCGTWGISADLAGQPTDPAHQPGSEEPPRSLSLEQAGKADSK